MVGDVTNNGGFTIGRWSTEQGFIRIIDKVKVYNRKLTDSEVTALIGS